MPRGPKSFHGIGPLAPWDLDDVDPEVLAADASEFDPAELSEFASADLLPDTASPEFRERLRAELWTMVDARYGARPPNGRGGGSGRGPGRGGNA